MDINDVIRLLIESRDCEVAVTIDSGEAAILLSAINVPASPPEKSRTLCPECSDPECLGSARPDLCDYNTATPMEEALDDNQAADIVKMIDDDIAPLSIWAKDEIYRAITAYANSIRKKAADNFRHAEAALRDAQVEAEQLRQAAALKLREEGWKNI